MSREAEQILAAVLVMDERLTRIETRLARLEAFTVRDRVAGAISRAGSDQAVAKVWQAYGPVVSPLDKPDRVALWRRAIARTAKLRGGTAKAAREWLEAILRGAKEAQAAQQQAPRAGRGGGR